MTEELLVEAYKTADGPWVTAMFFVGFPVLLWLEEVMDTSAREDAPVHR